MEFEALLMFGPIAGIVSKATGGGFLKGLGSLAGSLGGIVGDRDWETKNESKIM